MKRCERLRGLAREVAVTEAELSARNANAATTAGAASAGADGAPRKEGIDA
jgi:hypothetical protein